MAILITVTVSGCYRFQYNTTHISKIQESPIKNADGYIEKIVLTYVIDPKTPIPDGLYKSNMGTINTLKEFQVYREYENKYHNLTQINMLTASKYWPNDITVKNNTFKIEISSDSIKTIIERKLDGPYLILLTNNLMDFNVKYYRSATYFLELSNNSEYNAICDVENAKINSMGEKRDKCGYMKDNKYHQMLLPYLTNSYNYTDFANFTE